MKANYFIVPSHIDRLLVYVNAFDREAVKIQPTDISEVEYRRSKSSTWAMLIVRTKWREFREQGRDREQMDGLYNQIYHLAREARAVGSGVAVITSELVQNGAQNDPS